MRYIRPRGKQKQTNEKAKMSGQLEVKIEGKDLVIRIPMNEKPTPSATGKTLVVASSHGNQATTATVNGKPIILGLNAYIKNR